MRRVRRRDALPIDARKIPIAASRKLARMALIEPRTLKGFRDYLPEAMIPREQLVETARRVYRSYGFLPIDTPALEYEEILTGKGGEETDKQLYRFVDHGGRKVALRFDLTVPLARFAAQYANDLGLPFKRYHIACVWRGENTQRGRYREFMQCDFDTIGTESIVSDIETALVIHDLMRALGFERFRIHVNNRKLLTGLLEKAELTEKSAHVLRAIDKLDKIGPEKVREEIASSAGASAEQARRIVEFVTSTSSMDAMQHAVAGSSAGERGLQELQRVIDGARAAGVSADHLRADLSIARGLDYYTGTVYETVLLDEKVSGMGSVCSGGRYDDLASLYTKQRLPGVGASLGLDRLLAAMEELGLFEAKRATATVFLPYFEEAHLSDYLSLATALRGAGIGVELYPECKKLGVQLKYADRRGFRFALVAGGDEWRSGQCQVKDLSRGETRTVPMRDASGALSAELASALR
jgi:histidyl-tRNA synthetase